MRERIAALVAVVVALVLLCAAWQCRSRPRTLADYAMGTERSIKMTKKGAETSRVGYVFDGVAPGEARGIAAALAREASVPVPEAVRRRVEDLGALDRCPPDPSTSTWCVATTPRSVKVYWRVYGSKLCDALEVDAAGTVTVRAYATVPLPAALAGSAALRRVFAQFPAGLRRAAERHGSVVVGQKSARERGYCFRLQPAAGWDAHAALEDVADLARAMGVYDARAYEQFVQAYPLHEPAWVCVGEPPAVALYVRQGAFFLSDYGGGSAGMCLCRATGCDTHWAGFRRALTPDACAHVEQAARGCDVTCTPFPADQHNE